MFYLKNTKLKIITALAGSRSIGKNCNRRGFSLMELMIVIAIIGIMTSVVLIYPNNKTERQVEGAAREVVAVIREAQNYALTGKSASAICSNEYIFTYTDGTGNYGISGCIIMNYTLKDNINFVASGAIDFALPWGTASGSINTPIVLGKNSVFYTICVNSAGSVTESKGNVACL